MNRLDIVKKKLRTLKSDERIVAVILFGSWARNSQRTLSDIDICVIPAKDVSFDTLVRIMPDIDADVSYFYELQLHLRQKVFSEGKQILVNDKAALAETKSRTALAYMDFNPVRERLIRAMLAKGGFG